jgi:hypothetical protein
LAVIYQAMATSRILGTSRSTAKLTVTVVPRFAVLSKVRLPPVRVGEFIQYG